MSWPVSELNQALFLALNAPSQPPAWLVYAVAGLANSPVVLAPALLVALWVWGEPARRGALIAIAMSVVVAQGLNLALGLLWFDPRPFMIPLGHTLVAHSADNGFPSDHATLVWTLAAGLWLTGAAPRLGALTGLYGVAVAWSRIWLGVHFPEDMAMSAAVGLVVGFAARVAVSAINRTIFPMVDRVYESVIAAAHLPENVIPRRRSNGAATP